MTQESDKIAVVPDEKQLTRAFLRKIKRTKQKFMDALLRCDAITDAKSAETLRSAISCISNTIAAISEGNATLDDLKRYHIAVSLAVDEENNPTILNFELKQKEKSHPIPMNHYLEVQMPMGDPVKSKVISKFGQPCYIKNTFDFGPRTISTITTLLQGNIEFRLKKISNILGKRKATIVAMATAQLSPLNYSKYLSCPLKFVSINGSKTSYAFDAIISTEAPLVAYEDLKIDEIISVIPE